MSSTDASSCTPSCCSSPAPAIPAGAVAAVRERYAAAARDALARSEASCCGPSSCSDGGKDPITRGHYDAADAEQVPGGAVRASLGCGNPVALADLRPGQKVLDLGSGGGIDVLLSARRVGPDGFAWGIDMTDEMLELAERHRAEAGVTNAAFLKGTIDAVPLPDGSVDVVLSNCVVNLAADKGAVLREAFRVLRPGGMFAVSDMVAQGTLPAALRRDLESWAGCMAGALEEGEYRRLLEEAGFVDASVQVTRVFGPDELPASSRESDVPGDNGGGGRLVSAFVRARRP